MSYNPEILEEIIKAQDAFVWRSPMREKRERGPRWYVIMAAVAGILVIYAVLTSNFLFAFLILLGAIILILAGNQDPAPVLVQIGKNGIVVDGKLYEYKDLANFSIIYKPPETKLLYVESNSYFMPRLRLLLEEQNPIEVRTFLKTYLEENGSLQEEHASDILARLLKI